VVFLFFGAFFVFTSPLKDKDLVLKTKAFVD
jgi:hypothetical protein